MNDWANKKNDVLMRLRRAEGQLRGIQSMVDEEADCEKVVQQLAASRRALDKVFYKVVACALEQDLAHSSRDAKQIEKYTQLLTKYG